MNWIKRKIKKYKLRKELLDMIDRRTYLVNNGFNLFNIDSEISNLKNKINELETSTKSH
mgnify:CR=1 FL=1